MLKLNAASNKLGLLCLLLALGIILRLFWYPVEAELTYSLSNSNQTAATTPVSSDFGVVIERIGANAQIISDVDPYNSSFYQKALAEGVAHAKGTGKPGEGKNIFLFAHSSGDLITASRFNSVFYLLHHLDSGDQIDVWYHGKKYSYLVKEKKLVQPNNLSVLTSPTTGEQLTLMTCWPPGTTLQRLLVIAVPVE